MEQLQARIGQRWTYARGRERRTERADDHHLRSTANDETADQLALARVDKTTRRNVREMILGRFLRRAEMEDNAVQREITQQQSVAEGEVTGDRFARDEDQAEGRAE